MPSIQATIDAGRPDSVAKYENTEDGQTHPDQFAWAAPIEHHAQTIFRQAQELLVD